MTLDVPKYEIDIAAAAQDGAVQALDLSCFDRQDLLNLILQRSEVMFDLPRPGRIIKAWQDGDSAPILAAVDQLGDAVARRAAGVIHEEYKEIAPLLEKLAPKRIADIGCGYGFFDLFAAKHLKCEVLLIDLETNDRRNFGFEAEGAAYSSLAKARALLLANGVSDKKITLLNPQATAPESAKPVDLVVSLLSCGFHYPVDTYLPFLAKVLKPGGTAIFDLRERTADSQTAKLATFGEISLVASPPKARRVVLHKSKA